MGKEGTYHLLLIGLSLLTGHLFLVCRMVGLRIRCRSSIFLRGLSWFECHIFIFHLDLLVSYLWIFRQLLVFV